MYRKWDWLAFSQIIAVGVISLLIIFSLSATLLRNQLIFWAIGLLIFYVVSHISYKIWESFTPAIYTFSILLLVILFFIGDPVRGSIRWIDLGFFRIQPSEAAKVALILSLAHFFKERVGHKMENVLKSFLFVLPPFTLVLIQPDIGSSLTFLAIFIGITFSAGFKIRQMVPLFIIGCIAVIIFYELLAPYQKQRITTFISPEHDPLGTGYNIIQSKIAIGSGTFLGKGFGHGSQSQLNFLPEAESDFIFASISEQLGFVGAAIVISLFAWLITRLVSFAKDKERYAQLIIAGITSLLICQFVINVGMNMALLPVTGITFPLISYGGSSLLTTLFLLSLAFSIKKSV